MSKNLEVLTWLNLSCANSHNRITNDNNLTKLLDLKSRRQKILKSRNQASIGCSLVFMVSTMENRMRPSSMKG